jgi:hypothetical protein
LAREGVLGRADFKSAYEFRAIETAHLVNVKAVLNELSHRVYKAGLDYYSNGLVPLTECYTIPHTSSVATSGDWSAFGILVGGLDS